MWVYLIQSNLYPAQRYIGHTINLQKRLEAHEFGNCPATAPYRPWQLVVAIVFNGELKAVNFEKYLKSGSGRAFANTRLWS